MQMHDKLLVIWGVPKQHQKPIVSDVLKLQFFLDQIEHMSNSIFIKNFYLQFFIGLNSWFQLFVIGKMNLNFFCNTELTDSIQWRTCLVEKFLQLFYCLLCCGDIFFSLNFWEMWFEWLHICFLKDWSLLRWWLFQRLKNL